MNFSRLKKMKGLFRIIVFVLFNIISTQARAVDPDEDVYSAYVVEYLPIGGGDDSAVLRNVREYESVTKDIISIEKEVPDILVFPEKGLTGFELLEESAYSLVPSPKDRVVPCENETYNEILKRLSCAARDNQVNLVVNLAEQEPCISKEDCPERGRFHYNTNVAFDRNGTVIARYRKYHRVAGIDVDVDAPPSQEISVFETDFGVKFLLLTGSDLLYSGPVLDALIKEDIRDIVYPNAWFASLPFLVSVQFQAGWAYGNNVTIIAAGHHNPNKGCAGSGVYESNVVQETFMMEQQFINGFLGSLVSKRHNSTEMVPLPKKRFSHFKNTGNAHRDANGIKGLSKQGKANNEVHLGSENLEAFDSVPFEVSNTTGVLAANISNCTFYAEYTKPDNNKTYFYRLVAFNGPKGMESCVFLFCQGTEIQNCTVRPEENEQGASLTNIRITAEFLLDDKNNVIMPTTLLDTLEPVSIKLMSFEKEKSGNGTLATIQQLDYSLEGLLTFGILAIW